MEKTIHKTDSRDVGAQSCSEMKKMAWGKEALKVISQDPPISRTNIVPQEIVYVGPNSVSHRSIRQFSLIQYKIQNVNLNIAIICLIANHCNQQLVSNQFC